MVLKGRVKNGGKFQTSCTESDLRGSWGGNFGCCGIFMWQKTKVQLYDDPNTTGNTAGNLLNGGKFCEADGRIYYADPYDNDSLYVTDDKLQKSTKLHGDTVSYLNVAGDYIFYTRRNDRKSVTGGNVLALSKAGLFRLTTDGKNMGKLYDDPTQSVCLYGNYLYYQHYDEKRDYS